MQRIVEAGGKTCEWFGMAVLEYEAVCEIYRLVIPPVFITLNTL